MIARPLGEPDAPYTGLERKRPRLVVIALLVPTGTGPFWPAHSGPLPAHHLLQQHLSNLGEGCLGQFLQVVERWYWGRCLDLVYGRLEYLGYLRYNTGQHDLRVHRALPPLGAVLQISPILQEALDTFHETRSHPHYPGVNAFHERVLLCRPAAKSADLLPALAQDKRPQGRHSLCPLGGPAHARSFHALGTKTFAGALR